MQVYDNIMKLTILKMLLHYLVRLNPTSIDVLYDNASTSSVDLDAPKHPSSIRQTKRDRSKALSNNKRNVDVINIDRVRFLDLSALEQMKCKLLNFRVGHRSLGSIAKSIKLGRVRSDLGASLQCNSSGFCECCAMSNITARAIPKTHSQK